MSEGFHRLSLTAGDDFAANCHCLSVSHSINTGALVICFGGVGCNWHCRIMDNGFIDVKAST